MNKLAYACAVLACLLIACLAGCEIVITQPQPEPDLAQQIADAVAALIDKI